jgi:hypothetical protein
VLGIPIFSLKEYDLALHLSGDLFFFSVDKQERKFIYIETKTVQKYLQWTVQRRSKKETSDLVFVTYAFVLLIDYLLVLHASCKLFSIVN